MSNNKLDATFHPRSGAIEAAALRLGIVLLPWQREVARAVEGGEPYIAPLGVCVGRKTMRKVLREAGYE